MRCWARGVSCLARCDSAPSKCRHYPTLDLVRVRVRVKVMVMVMVRVGVKVRVRGRVKVVRVRIRVRVRVEVLGAWRELPSPL